MLHMGQGYGFKLLCSIEKKNTNFIVCPNFLIEYMRVYTICMYLCITSKILIISLKYIKW